MNYILVVDDDEIIREVVNLTLSDEGYKILEASNGKIALEVIEKQTQPPDLILLDMRMPVMDGWGFADQYRQTAGPHSPIVVLTAATDAAAFANQVEADGFLAKPFDLDRLIEIVEQHKKT